MRTLQKVNTTRFGELEYATEDVLTVRDGLLGFEKCVSFLLIEHREGSPFRWLQSLEKTDVAFLVVDPFQFFADYDLEIDDSSAEELALVESTPKVVYTIVTIPRGRPDDMSVNLAGPVIINGETRIGRQFVMENPAYSVRAPLMGKSRAETTDNKAA